MKGFCMPEELKGLHHKIIDLVREHKFTHLISDIVELEGTFDEANKWFVRFFNPKMVELGMTYEAIIQGKDLFAQLAAEELAENTELSEIGYHLRLFDSVEKGLEWFEEEKVSFPEKLKKANETIRKYDLPKEIQEDLQRIRKKGN
jgi:hypothetical protein